MSRLEYAQNCRIEVMSLIAITEDWREIVGRSYVTLQGFKKPPLGISMRLQMESFIKSYYKAVSSRSVERRHNEILI
jgi:hypothetical protein